jgi:hypothetical protein
MRIVLHKLLPLQCLLTAYMLHAAVSLAAQTPGKQLNFYITDFGINQWHEGLVLGADLPKRRIESCHS